MPNAFQSQDRVYQCVLVLGKFRQEDLDLLEGSGVNARVPDFKQIRPIVDVPPETDFIVCVGTWTDEERGRIKAQAERMKVCSPTFMLSLDSAMEWLGVQNRAGALTPAMKPIADRILAREAKGKANLNLTGVAKKIRDAIQKAGHKTSLPNVYAYLREAEAAKGLLERRKVQKKATLLAYNERKRAQGKKGGTPVVALGAQSRDPVDEILLDVDDNGYQDDADAEIA